MGLHIIDDTELTSLGPSEDGTYTGAMGGTEMMNKALYERVDNDLLNQFFIIKSRVRTLEKEKKNLLWLHDLWGDPEVQHLRDEKSRDRFAKLIFVSNYQLCSYNIALGVPYEKSIVLKNAIEPIPTFKKTKERVNLIYHTTPHRGLELLVPVVEKLSEILDVPFHLDVYSSFEAYGWKHRDEPYLDLFERIKNHPNMTYHGYQPNDVVRKALQEAHIFAYPNIWQETSCIAAIEAMSAECEIVCPNLAALPETTGNLATMYNYNEDVNAHANIFAAHLHQSIKRRFEDVMFQKTFFAKNWVDNFYNWDVRAAEWTAMLKGLLKDGKA